MTAISSTALRCFAGLFGACGVAGAAYAAHGAEGGMLPATAAAMLLVHAPALLGLSILSERGGRLFTLAGALLGVGVVLFSGDLFARIFLGDRLFASAAPIGGSVTILGWLMVSVGAVWPSRAR